MCVAGSRVSPPLPVDLRLALQRPPPHSSVPLRPSRSRPCRRCLPAFTTLSPHTTLLLAGNCGLARCQGLAWGSRWCLPVTNLSAAGRTNTLAYARSCCTLFTRLSLLLPSHACRCCSPQSLFSVSLRHTILRLYFYPVARKERLP
jgi:hypothetical protein